MSSERPQILGFLPTTSYWKQGTPAVRLQRAIVVPISGTGGFLLGSLADSQLATRALLAILGSAVSAIFALGLVERASRHGLKQQLSRSGSTD